ncbi:MAG: serine/threonine-protein kinase [Myxococcota bacterium]
MDSAVPTPTCPRCSQPRLDGARFCGSCGFRYDDTPASHPPPSRPSPAMFVPTQAMNNPTPGAGVVTAPPPANAPAPALPPTTHARSMTPRMSGGTADDPMVGTVVDGRYRVMDRLGTGGMGTVYRVVHERMRKIMALKLLNPALSADPVVRARFWREARAASLLESRHTVAVFDFGETPDGLLYLAMEYLRGETLASLLHRQGKLSPSRTARVLSQVLKSLEEAHAQGIVHRDIKPDNIFLVDSDEPDLVKVLDFGIAKGKRIADEQPQHSTRSDLVVGTPEYMAPEQARGHDVDGRADLWAVGVMMFECLFGRLPFYGPTPMDTLVALMERPTPRPEEAAPDVQVPPTLWAVVERALQKKRELRFESAAQMRDALMAATAEFASISTPPARPPRPVTADVLRGHDEDLGIADREEWDSFARQQKTRRRILVVLGAAAAVGLGVGVGTLLSPAKPVTTEVEPNNHPTQANLVVPEWRVDGELGVPVEGKGDVDRYVLELPAGPHVLTARVVPTAPGTVNLGLTAWVDDKLVAHGFGKKEPHPRIPNLVVEGRRLDLMVREENPTTDTPPTPTAVGYRLEILPLRPLSVGEEREPNNSSAAAGVLNEGQSINAWLAPPDDEDWFKVALPPDDRELEADVAPTPELAVDVSFYGSDGRKVARRAGKPGERVSLRVSSKRCGSPCYVAVEAEGRPGGEDPAYRLQLR